MPSWVLHLQTPLECLKEFHPSTWLIPDVPLRVFGCTAFIHNHEPNHTKFAPCAQSYKPFFPVIHLQGEGGSEEANWLIPFIPISSTAPSELILHDTVLPTNQVPWITYYRKNLRKEMVPPTDPLALVHESEPTQAQGTIELNNDNLYVEDDIVDVVEDDKTNMTIPKENSNAINDETLTDSQVRETSPDDSDKLEIYDPSCDMPIALRKGIRTEAMKSPEWKIAVTEEMGALEKNKTWDL
ncbi:reverse transcriptase [Cucumis melo var. makuwa]|uniref:Reverse transcriptase n=1 Tax=Cucumis melo var. makuwa TaxID=1194695 RepID=A0A5A7UCE7_CUCMM|nr:reverse transcriptase [Cucumis melo var. makuwa]